MSSSIMARVPSVVGRRPYTRDTNGFRARYMQVRLRALRASDLPIFFEHQCDAEAAQIAGSKIRTRPDFDKHWRKIAAEAQFNVRTIEDNGAVAGYISAFPKNGRSDIAYWLGREHRRMGIGRAAVSEFLEWYRERPIFGSVLATNIPSIAILRGCGFVTLAEERGPDGLREIVLRLDEGPVG